MARKDRGFVQRKIYLDPVVWEFLKVETGNASKFFRDAVDEKITREFPSTPDIGTKEGDDE